MVAKLLPCHMLWVFTVVTNGTFYSNLLQFQVSSTKEFHFIFTHSATTWHFVMSTDYILSYPQIFRT